MRPGVFEGSVIRKPGGIRPDLRSRIKPFLLSPFHRPDGCIGYDGVTGVSGTSRPPVTTSLRGYFDTGGQTIMFSGQTVEP